MVVSEVPKGHPVARKYRSELKAKEASVTGELTQPKWL